jgi:hypothetical protein
MDELTPHTKDRLVIIHNVDPSTSMVELENLMALELLKGLSIVIDALEVLKEVEITDINGRINLSTFRVLHDEARSFQRETQANLKQ